MLNDFIINNEKEIRRKIMVDVISDYCPQNHPCPVVNVCPTGAISQESPFAAPKVDEELCTECGLCTNYCPAFSMDK